MASVSKNVPKVKENVRLGEEKILLKEKKNEIELGQTLPPEEQSIPKNPTNIATLHDIKPIIRKDVNIHQKDPQKLTDQITSEDTGTLSTPENKNLHDMDSPEPEREISDSVIKLGHDEPTNVTGEILKNAKGDKKSDTEIQPNHKVEEDHSDQGETKLKATANDITPEQGERKVSSGKTTVEDKVKPESRGNDLTGKLKPESEDEDFPGEVLPGEVKPAIVEPAEVNPGEAKPEVVLVPLSRIPLQRLCIYQSG